MDPIYEEFNKKWKIVSKIVLGDEVGELADFKKWLIGTSRTAFAHKSSFSEKNVNFVFPYYSNSAKYASIEEIDLSKKFEPLAIDDLKDIDSITEAIKERVVYTGNMFLGESKFLSESTDIVSSSYVYSSAQVAYSKWIAYSYNLEYCEHLFGCQNIGANSSHSIRCSAVDTQVRCLEVHSSSGSYDSYFCNSLHNCRNCMFSFGLRSGSYQVGNLPLNQEEYSKIKKKLLEDIVDELKRKKSIPQLESLFVSLQRTQKKPVGESPRIPQQLHDDSMVSRICLNDYLEVAAVAYRAVKDELVARCDPTRKPDIDTMTPREMYDRFSERRRGTFLDLAPDDKTAFRKWHKSGAWQGLHPFEIIPSSGGGICLYASRDKPCYTILCNDRWLAKWYVKIIRAFEAAGIPFEAPDLERVAESK